MITYGDGLRPWLEARLQSKLADTCTYIGRVKDGNPVAVVAFSNYREGEDVELSVAGDPGSASRGLLACVWAYVFGQLGCSRCTVYIREDNAQSVKLAARLGFVYEGRLRKARNGKDVLVYGLLKEESCQAHRNRRSR